MATTKSRPKPSSSRNGTSASVGETVKDATGTAAKATRRARGPLIAAGAATAGLAGGLALGSKRRGRRRMFEPRRRVLGVPVGPKSGLVRTAELLRDGAKQRNSATGQVAGTGEELRKVREQLEQVNRRSPLEVVLDGLTHRRGAHRQEG